MTPRAAPGVAVGVAVRRPRLRQSRRVFGIQVAGVDRKPEEAEALRMSLK